MLRSEVQGIMLKAKFPKMSRPVGGASGQGCLNSPPPGRLFITLVLFVLFALFTLSGVVMLL